MRQEMEFEKLLSSVLQEMANPEFVDGAEQRLMMRVVADQPHAAKYEFVFSGGGEQGGEQNVFASLWSGLCEVIFAKPEPPLVLESRPVPVIDRMAVERDYSSTAYAFAMHALAVFLIGLVVRAQIRDVDSVRGVTPLIDPPVLRIVAKAAQEMGGGGGQRGETPVSKGRLPQLAQEQIVPPKAPPLLPPKIAVEPSVVVQSDVKLAGNVLPNLGLPNSPVVGASMGNNRGFGMGAGDGDGVGIGTGGSMGGGLRHVGGAVSAPEVLHSVEPEFSEEARRAKVSGDVQVYLWVDEHGNPSHVRVIRGVGMGLDERAVEAVKQYKFRPAMENGRPVAVEMYVDVAFRIF
jgi:periplasmic protein TonB